MEKMNSKKVGKVIGVALVVFLLTMVMQSCVVSAQDDPIDIYSVELNGVEKHTEVRPGEAVTVTVSYSLNTHVVTREDKSNVVVGFEHEAKICLIGETEWDTVTFDGWYHFKKTFGINAPTKPGTYYIYEVTTVGRTCEEIKVLYPNCLGRHQIADFEVIASESDERDQGAIEVTHVSLDFVGLEDWFNVEPGELLEARVCYDYLYPWHLQKHEYRVVVGYEDTAIFCIDEEIRREYPDNTGDGSDCTIFTMKASMEPGIYSFYKTYTKGLTCSEAKEQYESNPDARELIDHFEVKADIPDEPDKDEKWDLICKEGIKVDYVLRPGFFDVYWTEIYQRGNDIRIEHYTDDKHPIYSGSVSISISEDVKVDYTTGKVSWGASRDSEFTVIKPSRMDGLDEKSRELIFGSVPYLGWVLSMADYIDYVFGDQFKSIIYQETDLEEGAHMDPHEHFDDRNMLNYRDIVVIPWYLKDPAGEISIDCPKMSFGEVTQQYMVFRIDSQIYQTKVRHDIGRTIEFTSTWHTDDDPEVEPF